MARTIYVTASESGSGKSLIALGLVELLARSVKRVGVFRPVERARHTRDWVLDLLLSHDAIDQTYEAAVGVTYDDVLSDPEAALATIVDRFHEIEHTHDFVVVVGSDYNDVFGPTELTFNARIAANIGAPVVLVLPGDRYEVGEIREAADVAIAAFRTNHARVVALVANQTPSDRLDAVREELAGDVRVWAIPSEPLLYAPTLSQVTEAVGGRLVWGDDDQLDREVLGVVVGAMTVEHVLTRISDGDLITVPGDRTEILLGLLLAHQADGFPHLAGVLLSGGFQPDDVVARLMDGIASRLPVIATQSDSFEAATAAAAVKGDLTRTSQRKMDAALALIDTYADVDGSYLLGALDVRQPDAVTPLMFEYSLLERARTDRRRIVLPEGEDDRILRAASTVLQRGIADVTILGDPAAIRSRAAELNLQLDGADLRDPRTDLWREEFAVEYARLRAHKGTTVEWARDVVANETYFGTMMVQMGYADGMVSGATHTTAHTVRPAFEIIRTADGVDNVSSVFLMCLADQVLVYGDCAIFPDPTADELADIAISSAETARQFGIDPRVAMLSYSTGESGTGADVDKVRQATKLVHDRRPDLLVEGPIQYDAAVDPAVARTKMPNSAVAGHASVLVFPDLNTGNNTYKAVQRSSGAVAIGPVLQGLRKPVNDLSRGALVEDIVNTIAITAIQAQSQVQNQAPEPEGVA